MAQGQLPGRWHLSAAALSPFPSGYHFFVCSTNAAVAVLSAERLAEALSWGSVQTQYHGFICIISDCLSYWEMKFSVAFELRSPSIPVHSSQRRAIQLFCSLSVFGRAESVPSPEQLIVH